MEVFLHGCIARISRKNKPDDNVLIVCAVETNYKLLYICTHILREAGDNAYIVMDKNREGEFKEFLEKLLPQPFEAEESEIVDKVVKGEIALEAEENILTKESVWLIRFNYDKWQLDSLFIILFVWEYRYDTWWQYFRRSMAYHQFYDHELN